MSNILLDVNIQKKLKFFELDISFKLEKGLLAIQGLSGSGKTTTLDCISGIKTADSGYIKLNDKYLYSSEQKINLPIRKRKVGYVFQSYALFPNMTVRKNIFFAIDKKDETGKAYVLDLVEKLNITHLLDRYPSDISGGEKQRAAFARALAVRPDILLMDEPFSALDEDLKEKLYDDFIDFKSKENIPMILITHNRYEANRLADNIIHFENGKIVMQEKI